MATEEMTGGIITPLQAAGGPPAVGPPRGTMIGRFIVLHTLGSGGMGVVVSAYDAALDRKVAIKLLRSGADDDDADAEARAERLLREAQAMAKVTHRNVIAVHEVGKLEDQVFIAMEHIDGETLSSWLRTPRPLPAVVAVFAQAARGLAAAHAGGLVHRDFKPDNVLCARDGRVLVTDFGVAALAPAAAGAGGRSSALAHRLTRDGAVVGTPGYIAPEQLGGEPVDARADQFAFCVTLYAALFGVRPWSGPPEGEPRAIPRRTPVPRWLRSLVLRGLARSPGARHPSMAQIAAALERGGRRRRAMLLVVAPALLAATAAIAAATRTPAPPPCAGQGARLAGVWDRDVSEGLRRAFAATGRPDAAEAHGRAAAALDDYTGRWLAMRSDACLATAVLHEQSPALMDLRMACLDRRLDAVAAVARVLGRADAEIVQRAAAAAQSLPPLDECADADSLTAAVPRPRDPAARAAVARLEQRLDSVDALASAGKRLPGFAIAATAAVEADALGFAPARARALLRLARFQRELQLPGAGASAEAAAHAAAQAQDDRILAGSLALLASTLSLQDRHDEAEALRTATLAVAERSRDDRTRARVLHMAGAVRVWAGRFVEAERDLRAAMELSDRAGDGDTLEMVPMLWVLGGALRRLDRLDEAVPLLDRARSIVDRRLGPDSIMTDSVYYELGRVALLREDADGARAAFEHQVRIVAAAYGPDGARLVPPLVMLSSALAAQDRPAEALARAEEAVRIAERRFGPKHATTGRAELAVGSALRELDRDADARAHLERAVALRDAVDGGEAWMALAQLSLDEGRPADALDLYRRALELRRKSLPPAHPDVTEATAGVGRALVALRRPGEALPLLEEALAREAARAPRHAQLRARIAWSLAQALRARDAARARALASEALAIYAPSKGKAARSERPAIEAFLARDD